MRARLQQLGPDQNGKEFIIDAGGSTPHMMEGIFPTVTATRASGLAYWSSKRKRPVTVEELMRAQGVLDSHHFPGWQRVISQRQMGHICGNAICVPVLANIIRRVLLALGKPVT